MAERANAGIVDAEKLVGCEIVLDPSKSGMFVDSNNGLTLSFFKEGADRAKIAHGMDLTLIFKGIRYGLLRVIRSDKDVTERFGGAKQSSDWRKRPLFSVPKRAGSINSDKALISLLMKNKVDEVVRDINSLSNYATLNRVRELEQNGSNLSYQPRVEIIDALDKRMKEISGMTPVSPDHETDEVIDVKV